MRQEPGDEAIIKDSTVASLGIGFLQQSTPELIIGLRCHVNQLSIPVTPHNIMYIHLETVLIVQEVCQIQEHGISNSIRHP